MKKKIVVIDDEENICQMISDLLEDQNYAVSSAYNTEDGLKKVQSMEPDLVVMDLRMPTIGGLELCRIMKTDPRTKHIPVIMLTVQNLETDKVIGLEMGADDYITKPFGSKEFLARIKAIFRRTEHQRGDKAIFKSSDLIVDLDKHQVKLKDKEIALTPKEFDLLCVLLKNADKVVQRSALMSSVWGYEYTGTMGTIDVHIRYLRKKLGPYGKKIKTVVGLGYRFEN